MNIYKAVREQAALKIVRDRNDVEAFFDDQPGASELPSPLDRADHILSIRLNDKGEPDPEGRYAVKVVDLKAGILVIDLQSSNELWRAGATHVIQVAKKQGFARIVEE